MAVHVNIKSKGLLKKKIKLKDILFDNMGYGSIDEAYRLKEEAVGENIIVYNKEEICRGFEIILGDNQVDLNMNLPTSAKEITFFYEYIKKICKKLKTDIFYRENVEVSIDNIDEFIEQDKRVSINTLIDFEKQIKNKKMDNTYVFGVMFPVALNKEELKKINKDLDKFGKFMNELQQMDIYYPSPGVYKKEDGKTFSVYVLTENCKSAFPLKPKLFLDNETKVDEWYVGTIINGEFAGLIPYNKFIKNIDTSNKFDATHFIVKKTTKELQELLDKYKVEI